MVDEAQDLNETQVRLLRLLTGASDASASPGTGPHRFLVGDAKQSIYRFRGSDVAHFNRYEAEIGRSGGSVRALTQSFRTHDELVTVCNTLFDRVLAAGAGPAACACRAAGRPAGRGRTSRDPGGQGTRRKRGQRRREPPARGGGRRGARDRGTTGRRRHGVGRRRWARTPGDAARRGHPDAAARQRARVRAGAGEPRRAVRHAGRSRLLHPPGGARSHQPAGMAGRAGRPHRAGRRAALAAVHDRRPDAARLPPRGPELDARAGRAAPTALPAPSDGAALTPPRCSGSCERRRRWSRRTRSSNARWRSPASRPRGLPCAAGNRRWPTSASWWRSCARLPAARSMKRSPICTGGATSWPTAKGWRWSTVPTRCGC